MKSIRFSYKVVETLKEWCLGLIFLAYAIGFVLGVLLVVVDHSRYLTGCERTRAVFHEQYFSRVGLICNRSITASCIRFLNQEEESKLELDPHASNDVQELYTNYIYDICERYRNVEPELVMSIVYHESRWDPSAKNYNGSCVGLMQISKKWHTKRAEKLTGSTDLSDPYVNLSTGIDLLNDLISEHGKDDLDLAIMRYNGSSDAYARHAARNPTPYARSVLSYMEELKNG